MMVQVNSDRHIDGHEALATRVREVVEGELSRISHQVTRVEVHLSDENGQKSGQRDKRCMMEARLEGRQPIAVTHTAATLLQSIDGAAARLTRLVENTLGRLQDQRRSARGLPSPDADPTE